jgi:imidazolonepropionase
LEIIGNDVAAPADGKIVEVGITSELSAEYSGAVNIDASNKIMTPDFAGSREIELELKIKGAGYLEILQRGGGILQTFRDTRAASKDELIRICEERSENLMLHGTTTIEAKSGYELHPGR